MKYQVELSAAQVIALFEMCEFCSAVVHRDANDAVEISQAFVMILSIQDKLDGCENLKDESPSLIDQATKEVESDKPWQQLPELGVRENLERKAWQTMRGIKV